jgi:hypothetical protein
VVEINTETEPEHRHPDIKTATQESADVGSDFDGSKSIQNIVQPISSITSPDKRG